MLAGAILLTCGALAANDIVFLHGRIVTSGGAAPGKSAVIEVQCRGVDPVKQTVAGKDGKFNWKVERDEFNHIARSVPATTTDIDSGGVLSGACELRAVLKGYESSAIDLRDFVIGKDLKLPDLVLKEKSAGK
jgi:6-phosphofructokinase